MTNHLELRSWVRTTRDSGSDDWNEDALPLRRWGVTGIIVRVSDRLTFLVRHQDGTQAWYEYGEVEPLE